MFHFQTALIIEKLKTIEKGILGFKTQSVNFLL